MKNSLKNRASNASTSEAINAAANAAGVNADELANRLAVYGATNRQAVGLCLDSMLPTSGSNWFEATEQRALVQAGREAFCSLTTKPKNT
jgi:hypothetical protein